MSDVEVGRIYAEVGADIGKFLASMDAVAQSMRDTAVGMGADAGIMDAALASVRSEAESMARSVAEAAVEASGAMTGAAADVSADAALMAHELDHAGDEASSMGRRVMEAAVESATSMTGAAVSVIGATTGMALGFAQASLGAISFMGVVWSLAIALGAVVVAAAPFAAAMAAVFALGALGQVFVRWKDGSFHLVAGWRKAASDIFDILHELSKAVTKPLFKFLLGELQQLDKWMHTANFKRDMQALGKAMLETAKAGIQAAKWIYDHWDQIKKVLLGILGAAKTVGEGIAWLAREFAKYWPEIKHAAEVAYHWFMQNLWPGLKRAFSGIAQIVGNLAKGFEKAWPDISKALSAAWGIIHPILDLLATILGKVQDALNWLAKNSSGAFSALAQAVTAVAGVISATLGGIATAIDAVVSGMKFLASFGNGSMTIGPGGGGTGGAQSGRGNPYAHVPKTTAVGGIATGPQTRIVGEAGDEAIIPLTGNRGRSALAAMGGGRPGLSFGRRGAGQYITVLIPDHEIARLTRAQAAHRGRFA